MEKGEQINQIKAEILNLKKSPLFKYRKENNYLPVVGQGSLNAKIMLVGEAPGKNEALSGNPFCGSAGKILDQVLSSAKLDRQKIYITNIVNDRPPKNRDPLPKEIRIYAPFLDRQIEIIKPKIIATLGRFSMEYILAKYARQGSLKTISQLHGQVFEGQTSYGKIKIIPLYHPAAAIYRPKLKEILKKDFKNLTRISK